MNKVIIKALEGELTNEQLSFAYKALDWFKVDLDSGKFGDGWNSCGYGLAMNYAITQLNKSGSITITVQ